LLSGAGPVSRLGPAENRRKPIATAPSTNEPRINDRIRAREVLLVDAEGNKLGVKPLPEALHIAREEDLDLVEVAPQAVPPVCRLMDYGKWKFDEAQRAKESRRKTTNVTVKEMKYRPKIGIGDFDTKTRQVARFLGEGHKVKITIMFRGREMSHPELGKKILDKIAEQVGAAAKVEAAPRLDGRNMVMVLAPDKRVQQPQRAQAAAPGRRGRAPDDNGAGEAPEPTAGASETPEPTAGASETPEPATAAAPASETQES
jgi:translation initiation factor IF-3